MLIVRALLFGVYIRAPDDRKLPNGVCNEGFCNSAASLEALSFEAPLVAALRLRVIKPEGTM